MNAPRRLLLAQAPAALDGSEGIDGASESAAVSSAGLDEA